jgi:hypothetical protein
MFYAALAAAWNAATTPPDGVTGATLAGLTTDQKIAAVNGWTVAGPTRDVPVKIVSGYLLANLKMASLLNYVDSTPVGANPAAHLVAQNLIAALTRVSQPPDFGVSDPAILAGLTSALETLVADPLCGLNSDDAAALLALARTKIPWWQSVGLTSPINTADLQAAGGLS